MESKKTDLLREVAEYYSAKLAQHGETPQGVDWNGHESQTLRFEQLTKIISTKNSFTINDLGCGYGAFYDFLCARYKSFSYSGFDVSQSMIHAAEQRYKYNNAVRFLASNEIDQEADFGVASGIFNVRMERSNEEWKSHVESSINLLNRTSRLGFAFNCLTTYSDADKMQSHLYYADPCALFDLCKRLYARNVTILHDYELYEFTILVRKHT